MDINLDIITEKPARFRLGGKVYEVYPLKLKPYLATQGLQADFAEAIKTKDLTAQVSCAVKLIMAYAPCIPEAVLMDATPSQLTLLMEKLGKFQNGGGDEGNAVSGE